MPILGEVRKARDIGRTGYHRYIRVDCPECREERWVVLTPRGPMSVFCKSCSPRQFVQSGSSNPHWKGGRRKAQDGYIQLWLPKDDFFFPMANKRYVLEHRLVMAKHLKRCLLAWEVVHHINGVRDDNRLANLQLLPSRSFHITDTLLKSQLSKLEQQLSQQAARITILEAENVLLTHEVRSHKGKAI